jgi:hypothetical protein
MEAEVVITTRSGRIIKKADIYVSVTKISQKEWKEEAMDKAIKAELKMLFGELQGIVSSEVGRDKDKDQIPKSHMFVVAKHLVSGSSTR